MSRSTEWPEPEPGPAVEPVRSLRRRSGCERRLDVSLSDRTAAVTDACSPLGAATALTLTRRGATVVLLDQDADGVLELATTVNRSGGGRASPHPVDLTDSEAVHAAATAVAAAVGPIDLIVLAAAEVPDAPASRMALPKPWRRSLEENAHAVRNTIGAFADQLVAAGERGVAADIVTVAGAAISSSRIPRARLWDHLRAEFSGRGVRFTAIERGMIGGHAEPPVSGMTRSSGIGVEHGDADHLSANDIADLIGYVVGRPEHVALPEVTIMAPKEL